MAQCAPSLENDATSDMASVKEGTVSDNTVVLSYVGDDGGCLYAVIQRKSNTILV